MVGCLRLSATRRSEAIFGCFKASHILLNHKMKSKTDRTIVRTQKSKHIQGQGLNWVLLAGGALLSTLSIRLGFKLKQALETKRPANASNALKGNGNSTSKSRLGACPMHSDIYCFTHDEDGCYQCLSGISQGMVEIKRPTTSPMSKETDPVLPLVTIPPRESNKENGMIWASSPERLELPRKPFHYSNSSDSPCVSESGSDIVSKREVIHKLRQQLNRRDEMILEMQAQITDLQNSLNTQLSHSSHLQVQLDSANRDLFESEREIQRLRKAIVYHCVGETGSPEKPTVTRNQQVDERNGHANGFFEGGNNLELQCLSVDMGRGRESERNELLKREVEELKELIQGKEFLLQSYKEQKMELCSTVKKLQVRLASQVPNIL
ncbi:uncharacterized protein LOC143876444 isoform X2 [Tasmannia lanceolata]|uniref:uncharacterized protein LOC143876444 isoform X2 n=1 Tax=Tasmannia lanceolata TaxID=3420 RepID=UPI004063B1C1